MTDKPFGKSLHITIFIQGPTGFLNGPLKFMERALKGRVQAEAGENAACSSTLVKHGLITFCKYLLKVRKTYFESKTAKGKIALNNQFLPYVTMFSDLFLLSILV